jgi:hypothetical protein
LLAGITGDDPQKVIAEDAAEAARRWRSADDALAKPAKSWFGRAAVRTPVAVDTTARSGPAAGEGLRPANRV